MHPWTIYPTDNNHPRVEVNDAGGDALIIAGIHGDEPSGWEAIKAFYREHASDVTKPVTFLFANPHAAQKDTRFLERDLNRSFGSEYDAEDKSFEMQLAGRLQPIITSFEVVVSLHSTQSTDEPFAIFGTPISKTCLQLLRRVGVSKAVYTPRENQRGSLIMYPNVLEIECGFQKSDGATENAKEIIKGTVAFIGGLENHSSETYTDVRIFSLTDSIPKPDEPVDILVNNLTTVPAQTLVAQSESRKYFAPRDFAPILVSANGYENILGYYGEELGWLSEAQFDEHPRKSNYISNIHFP